MDALTTTLLELGAPAAALGSGALYARARMPRTYWSTIGFPLTVHRIRRDYEAVMESCGLTVDPSFWRAMASSAANRPARPAMPQIRRITASSTGMRIRLRLARGQETADVLNATEKLRHAWGVHAVYASEVKPGIVDLRVVGFDVLRDVRMPRRAGAKSAGLLRVPVALRADGTVHHRDYRQVPNGLDLGANQSGKSMFTRNLVHGLAAQPVALVGIDCKRGVEQRPFAPRLSALATDQAEALGLLLALLVEMDDRYDLIRAHQGVPGAVAAEDLTSDIWGLPEKLRPVPIVVLIDEIAELFLVASKVDEERRNQAVTALIRLAQLARAAGIYLEIAGQRFGSELGKGATLLRSQLTGRTVHRVNDLETARMGLGDISEVAMLAATRISPDMPGTAVAGDTSGRWYEIRTPYRSLADVAERCAEFAHLTPELPRLAAFRPTAPAGQLIPADIPPVPSAPPVFAPAPAAE
ncbi:FtsK/SpoIIIE domain-containing protein [Kitasatospora putterlickiae]|uniref:FtsK/SpoIIIE domain-containing protein n=1 Tax=Kitasatospora putterlickiae TaxID=221725 RepID=A0ABP4J308_9ACTN